MLHCHCDHSHFQIHGYEGFYNTVHNLSTTMFKKKNQIATKYFRLYQFTQDTPGSQLYKVKVHSYDYSPFKESCFSEKQNPETAGGNVLYSVN